MPLYTFCCPTCSAKQDIFSSISERDLPTKCDRCGELMQRQISAPAVRGDYEGYACPITGDWIEGRRAHEENLKKHNCRVFEPGEKDAFHRRRAAEDADFESRIGDTVEQLIHEMPAKKRESLVAELQNGATAEVVRTSLPPTA